MCRHQCKESRITKNQVDIDTEETNKALITDANEMEIYELSDKGFRIIPIEKFSELQEHTNN